MTSYFYQFNGRIKERLRLSIGFDLGFGFNQSEAKNHTRERSERNAKAFRLLVGE
jgi:hypothetical protein